MVYLNNGCKQFDMFQKCLNLCKIFIFYIQYDNLIIFTINNELNISFNKILI